MDPRAFFTEVKRLLRTEFEIRVVPNGKTSYIRIPKQYIDSYNLTDESKLRGNVLKKEDLEVMLESGYYDDSDFYIIALCKPSPQQATITR